MRLVKFIQFLRDRLRMVLIVCYAVLALLVLADMLFVDKEHAHTAVEHWPAFWTIFGFAGCVVIIIASKWFGHAGIMQREDYYDE